MNTAKYTVDGAKFHTIDGEIFGMSGSTKFVEELSAAVKFLSQEQAASSVKTNSGHEVSKGWN